MTDRRALLAAAAALAWPAAASAIPVPLPFGGKRKPTVDLAAIVRETGAPALAAAVVTRKGFDFKGVAGRRRADRPDSATEDDAWQLGACTKAMTAALYARYVEAGRAAWGARLPKLFPDLKLHEAWGEVRIDDLLAHRSGVTDVGVVDAEFLGAARAARLAPREQRTDVARVLLAEPPMRPPGGFEYANLNYVLAGAALERISNRPWEGAITRDLLRPAGMTRTAFGAPIGAAPWGHRLVERRLTPIDPAGVAENPPVLAPAGGIDAPLDDYARFVRIFLADGGGLLKPESLARLARPWSNQDGQFGMGWQVFTTRAWADGPVLASEGSNGLWHASVQAAPARSLAFIACANAEDGGGAEACERAMQAMLKVYGAA